MTRRSNTEPENDVIVPANSLFCRVCGLRHDEPPWGENGDEPSFEFCECCGAEFGYEDSGPAARLKFRKEWASGGYHWFKPDWKPEIWDPVVQLRNILPDTAIEEYAAIADAPSVRSLGK